MSIKLTNEQKVFGISALITAAMVLSIVMLIKINEFFDTYRFRFQSPVIIQAPMWIEKRPVISGIDVEATASATPTAIPTQKEQVKLVQPVYAQEPTHEKIIRGKTNGDIVWKVFRLESSAGANDGCKRQGKFNGFGYRQNSKEWVCYDTFEEVAHYVSVLFEERMQQMSLAEALCLYNTGTKSKDCKYYRDFMAL